MRQFSFRDLDWALIIISLAISALGILQIYSAHLCHAYGEAPGGSRSSSSSSDWWSCGLPRRSTITR